MRENEKDELKKKKRSSQTRTDGEFMVTQLGRFTNAMRCSSGDERGVLRSKFWRGLGR